MSEVAAAADLLLYLYKILGLLQKNLDKVTRIL